MRRVLDSVRFHNTNEVWDTRTSTSQKLRRRRIAFSSALAGNENRTSSPLVVSMTAGYESEIREQERLKKLPNQRKHAVDTGHLS